MMTMAAVACAKPVRNAAPLPWFDFMPDELDARFAFAPAAASFSQVPSVEAVVHDDQLLHRPLRQHQF